MAILACLVSAIQVDSLDIWGVVEQLALLILDAGRFVLLIKCLDNFAGPKYNVNNH